MDSDEITFQDLLGDGTDERAQPASFAQLLAEGFPEKGGLAELAVIAQIPDPGPKFVAVRNGYLQILELQRRAARGV